MDSHMTAVESNKRHKAAGLLAALVLVLILVGWIYYVFSPKELSNVLDFQPSEATDYTVTEMPNAVSSKSRSLDDTPLIEAKFSEPNEVETAIGKHCAALIEDGATLQMGIGAIPNAVLSQLGGHKNLGIHTEMFADGVLPLG